MFADKLLDGINPLARVIPYRNDLSVISPAINDPTTAVQALNQIEDLVRRLGRRQLDAGYACDVGGATRVTFPVPTWEDYLHLSFDEIRQYGAGSIQVMRRLRAVLAGLAEFIVVPERRGSVIGYLDHLNLESGGGDQQFSHLRQCGTGGQVVEQ